MVEQENGRRRSGRLRRRAEEFEENEWIERLIDEIDSDGGGESNDNNDVEQMEGDEENDSRIDEDNDESEDDYSNESEDDHNDVSDSESVDMAEEIIDEIDEQLSSDDLKHFMLHFHKGTYDDELKNAIEIDKLLLYDNNLGVNLFADISSARIGTLKTKIHQRINEVESNQGNYILQIVVRINANGQIDRVIWHDPTLDEYWEKLFITLRKKLITNRVLKQLDTGPNSDAIPPPIQYFNFNYIHIRGIEMTNYRFNDK